MWKLNVRCAWNGKILECMQRHTWELFSCGVVPSGRGIKKIIYYTEYLVH